MPWVESQETVPCAARACQSNDEPRAACCWHNERVLTANTASVLRIAALLVATLLLGIPGVWAALALWYQAPGGPLRSVIVLLWSAFTVGVLIALWQGRAGLAFLTFAVAFAVILIWWQSITPTNGRVWADDVAQITHGSVE